MLFVYGLIKKQIVILTGFQRDFDVNLTFRNLQERINNMTINKTIIIVFPKF